MSISSLRRFLAARPSSGALFDVLIAATTFAGSLALLRHGGISPFRPGSGELDVTGVVLAACSTLPLVAWRRSPFGVFALTGMASVLLAGLAYRIDLLLGPSAALYLLAASRGEDKLWTWRTTLTVMGLLLAYLGASAVAHGAFPGFELLHTGLAWAVAWFAGERTRLRGEHVAELRDRALRVARDAERERLLAVAEERARIARDLHDSAGHAISAIAVRAGAARLRHDKDPDRSRAALEAIEDVARRTVEDIDQMVGMLREEDPARDVVDDPPGLASLESLIAQHQTAGLRVELSTTGARRGLVPSADQAAYRILQEALTNAARHGAGGARIELSYGDGAVGLTVTNPARANGEPRPGGGHGLVGMRERANLLGGTLEAERASGVFRVRARIPYGGRRS